MRGIRSLRTLAAAAAVAVGATSALAYDVDEIGSFHIGGQPVSLAGLPEQEIKVPGGDPIRINPNGDYHSGQMYVQYVKQAHPHAKYPLLLWHTGGITGASWETKPDGNPGWMQYFLRQGHSVYVSDAVERGRASFARPEIYKSDAIFRDKQDGWEIFRIGPPGSYRTSPAERKANPGVKFPLESYDTLQMQAVARWAVTGDATLAAYNALVQRVCPCVIMAHGQAGLFAFRASLTQPEKVKALIAIEPAFAPSSDHPEISRLRNTPHLFVWGDFIDTNPTWVGHVQGVRPYFDALVAKGVPATWMDMPAEGLKGNTHMPMMDSNSDVIAARLQGWMTRNGLMGGEAVAAQAKPAVTKSAEKAPVKAHAPTKSRGPLVQPAGN